MKSLFYSIITSVIGVGIVFAQTFEQRQKITSNLDWENISFFQECFQNEYNDRQNRILDYLNNNLDVNRSYIKDGIKYEIYDIVEGQPRYQKTYNLGAEITINSQGLYENGSLGLNIQGQDMVAGIWDGGIINSSHQELQGKIVSASGTSVENHATHVGGTILARGFQADARGIAFDAELYSRDWNNDFTSVGTFAQQGYLTSNHSYGYNYSGLALWEMGAYDSYSRNVDFIHNLYPNYVMVIAAGNDRDNYTAYNPSKGGYDLITGRGTAKNAITVGAVQGVSNYIGPFSVFMSTFSNWGPTDDGRIKPDCVAKGVGVYSCTASSNSSYSTYQGTSMAAPAITGLVVLLQQYYNELNSSFLTGAGVKGLILHSCREAGSTDGPDYKFGWGLPDAVAGANVITNNSVVSTPTSYINESTLGDGSFYNTTVLASGTEPLKVSISWNDPAGSANNGTVDSSTPALINDLDLKVEQNGTTYFPWKLSAANYTASATRNSTNDVDNFERVDIENPSGTYTITVDHKGSLQGGSQDYTLIVSGGSVLGVEDIDNANNSFEIYPNPVSDFLKIKSTSDLNNAQVYVFNVNGQLVKSTELDNSNTLNVQDLEKGNYVIVINQNGEKQVKKFIKN